MKKFNHVLIAQEINKLFNLTSYEKGNFIFFFKKDEEDLKVEIGFIEKIPATKKHFYTIYTSFFDLENPNIGSIIVKEINTLYKEQKKNFTKQVNVVLSNANDVPQEFLFN